MASLKDKFTLYIYDENILFLFIIACKYMYIVNTCINTCFVYVYYLNYK